MEIPKKTVERMAECALADIANITQNNLPDISKYDIIGFASGIYFHSFHEKLEQYIKSTDFMKNQKVFLVAICGVINYTKRIKKILQQKSIEYIGSFQCRGYGTFGIFGKLGGMG